MREGGERERERERGRERGRAEGEGKNICKAADYYKVCLW